MSETSAATEPYVPKHLRRWSTPPSWFGQSWHGYYMFMGRNRDSKLIDVHNFDVALEAIGGEHGWVPAPGEMDDEAPAVAVVCENHWAVGWIEWIAIHESQYETLQKADEIAAALSDYPLLSEDRYSEKEWEAVHEMWERTSLRERIADCVRDGYSMFAARLSQPMPERVYERYQEGV